MRKYKVKADVILNIGGQSVHCKEGDVVSLTAGQANDLRAWVEPVRKPRQKRSK